MVRRMHSCSIIKVVVKVMNDELANCANCKHSNRVIYSVDGECHEYNKCEYPVFFKAHTDLSCDSYEEKEENFS